MATYSTAGRYQSGYWLVANSRGQGEIVAKKNLLPPAGTGIKYYYLGSTPDTANTRILDALNKLGVNMRPGVNIDVTQADKKGTYTIPSRAGGLLGFLQGVQVLPLPIGGALSGAAATAEESAATTAAASGESAAAGAAAGSGGGGLASKIASSITSPADFLALAAWLFTPVMWLRMAEFLFGTLLMMFGIYFEVQSGRDHTPIPTPRRVVQRVVQPGFARDE